jgi:hypothetical protein
VIGRLLEGPPPVACCVTLGASTCSSFLRTAFFHQDHDRPISILTKYVRMNSCRFFAKSGGCARGTSCRYVHDANLNPLVPAFVPMELSTRLSTIEINDRNIEPKTTPKDNRSEVPCVFFQKGQCRKGHACPFAHPAEDAKEAESLEAGDVEVVVHPFQF